MARLLLSGVLLLAAVCCTGGTSDDVTKQSIEENREKLAARIDKIEYTSHGTPKNEYTITNISTTNASHFQVQSIGAKLILIWPQPITFVMDAEFTICDLTKVPTYTNRKCNHPMKIKAKPTASIAFIKFTRPLTAPGKKSGSFEYTINKEDIEINALGNENLGVRISVMKNNVEATVTEYLWDLSIVVNKWLDEDVLA